MKSRFILLGSVLNSVAVILAFFLGTIYSGRAVHAQENTQQVEQITPGVTTGTFGAGLILAHQIQSDGLVVNGYDLLKLHQNTLNYLATQIGANQAALQAIIANSKAEKVYTVKVPSPPSPKPKGKQP